MMRILLVTRFDDIVGGSNSIAQIMFSFIRYSLEHDPGLEIDIVLNKRASNVKGWAYSFIFPEWPNWRRVKFIHLDGYPFDVREGAYGVGFPLLRYLRSSGRLQKYDAVISNAFPSNPMMKAFLQATQQREIPLIGWSVWTAANDKYGMWDYHTMNDSDVLSEMVGSMVCDHIVFESEKAKADNLSTYRQYFKPSVIQRMLGRISVVNNGIQSDRVLARKEPARYPPRALYSSYYSEDGDIAIKTLIDAYRIGKLSSVTINLMAEESESGIPDWVRNAGAENVKVVYRLPHDEYLRLVAEHDVFLSFVNHGTYGIRFGEMMAAGLVPVVHTEQYKTFCHSEYPFHTDDRKELPTVFYGALAAMKSNPDMYRETVAHIEKHHDARKNMVSMYEIVKGVSQ